MFTNHNAFSYNAKEAKIAPKKIKAQIGACKLAAEKRHLSMYSGKLFLRLPVK